MRNAMSTVIIVGAPPLTMIGTESTESMVTKERMRPTTKVPVTCGSAISTRMRGREERDERRLLPHKGDDDAAPIEKPAGVRDVDDAEPIEGVVHQPVLGEEG